MSLAIWDSCDESFAQEYGGGLSVGLPSPVSVAPLPISVVRLSGSLATKEMDMDTAEVVARLSEESYKQWTQGFFKDLASYDSLIGM